MVGPINSASICHQNVMNPSICLRGCKQWWCFWHIIFSDSDFLQGLHSGCPLAAALDGATVAAGHVERVRIIRICTTNISATIT